MNSENKEGLKARDYTAIGLAATLLIGAGIAKQTGLIEIATQYATQDDCTLDLKNNNEQFELTRPSDGSIVVVSFPDQEPNTQDRHTLASQVAIEEGLTLFDETKPTSEIQTADSTDEVLDIVDTFTTNNYGFNVEMPKDYNILNMLETPPVIYETIDRDELELENVQKTSIMFLENLYYIPREVIDIADLKKVIIVDGISIEPNIIFDFFGIENNSPKRYSSDDTIYLDYEGRDPWLLNRRFRIQLAKAIDIGVCGIFGAQRDELYKALRNQKIDIDNLGDTDPNITSNFLSDLEIFNEKNEFYSSYLVPDAKTKFSDLSPIDQEVGNLYSTRINHLAPGFLNYWQGAVID